jgi:DNA repair exonuclease SbcCD nuclease subunit
MEPWAEQQTMTAQLSILHMADVHLDRAFVGLSPEDARVRRRELRDALQRCLTLAGKHQVQAITIGGDLWEDEHVTPDTCRWVASQLGDAEVPVVLVAGNHDPLRPGGPYQRVDWPDNVTLLPAGPELHRKDIGELSIWGMSWGQVPLTAEVLDRFHVPLDGRVHLLLLHGTLSGAAFDDAAYCRFTAQAVREAGFAGCLAGHLHAGGVREEIVVYPGSPEPLAWDETDRHAVALVRLVAGVELEVDLIDVNQRRCALAYVECDGAGSSADVARELQRAVTNAAAEEGHEGLCLRAVLSGRLQPGCQIDLEDLAAAHSDLAVLELRDETKSAFDLETLAGQSTALGEFIRDLQARIAGEDEGEATRRQLELALDLGLRAMHGDELVNAS